MIDISDLLKDLQRIDRERDEKNKDVPITSVDTSQATGLGRPRRGVMLGVEIGSYVAVRLVYSDKTHLGVYIGDLPMGVSTKKKDGVLHVLPGSYNPAMWIPSLNQLVFGVESWWGVISSPDDMKKITDQDIDSVWYVQALKSLTKETEN